ncbi:hypothetical protein ACRYCC_38075 [Actinomadura scrupuli]|uniref:hypothetical protein n=1 Tax=Actinomadura scrupuli TaxID=559629 RepID=UPI003D973C5D
MRVNRRTAYAAFTWVMVFLAWHVVWAVTGLEFPTPSDHQGTERVLAELSTAVVLTMVVVGILVPVALARPWGRRIPRWMLVSAAWAGCVLLGGRGLIGVADSLGRATGILPRGLTGLTTAQVMGTGHPSAWALFAGGATDVLFVIGGLAFGLAALGYQRLSPARTARSATG